MTSRKRIKVIFDTNILISFLIGKRLQCIKGLITERKIQIVLSEQLLREIKEVSQRPRLARYFQPEDVYELILFLSTVGENYKTKSRNVFDKDPKDAFLLDLIEKSKADYLVTGDHDLLQLKRFGSASIITPSAFEKEINAFENS